MKNLGKRIAKISGVLLGLGILLVLLGIGMGAEWRDLWWEGNWSFPGFLRNFDGHPHVETAGEMERIPAQDVRCLEVDVDAALVCVETWEEDAVGIETSGRFRHYESGFEDGDTYQIEAVSRKRRDSPVIRIYVPEGKVFDRIDMEVGAAKAEVLDIRARRVLVEAGAGQVYYRGTVEEGGEFECGAGEVTLELQGGYEEYDYRLECGIGEICLNGEESFSGLGWGHEIDHGAGRPLKLECGVGRIEVYTE